MGRPLAERLAAGTDIAGVGGCWLWTRSVRPNGYGQIKVDGRNVSTHRLSYEIHVGPIPAGLQIDHLCGVRRCCNPAHLEAVTPRVNTNRAHPVRTSCIRGHAYSPENTYLRKDGARRCLTCHREARRIAVGRAA